MIWVGIINIMENRRNSFKCHLPQLYRSQIRYGPTDSNNNAFHIQYDNNADCLKFSFEGGTKSQTLVGSIKEERTHVVVTIIIY